MIRVIIMLGVAIWMCSGVIILCWAVGKNLELLLIDYKEWLKVVGKSILWGPFTGVKVFKRYKLITFKISSDDKIVSDGK